MKIGATELIVIFIVALLVIGPDKLPYYAKKLGAALKEFKKVSSDMTKDVRESVIEPLEEAQKPLRDAIEPFEDIGKSIKKDLDDVNKDIKNIGFQEGRSEGREQSGRRARRRGGDFRNRRIFSDRSGRGKTGNHGR